MIIQFGHNDEKKDSPERYADPKTTYRENLRTFVRESRARGASPILATSIVRRRFGSSGEVIDTHGEYPEAVREVAKELNVPLLDLEARTKELLGKYGVDRSKGLFLSGSIKTFSHRFPMGSEMIRISLLRGIPSL